jgi:hypothetical protein
LPATILESWKALTPEVRAALIASEQSSESVHKSVSISSLTDRSSKSSDDTSDKVDQEGLLIETDAETGTETILRPLERAPKNVFEITKNSSRETTSVEKASTSTITTKTTIMTTTKGWRNIFTLPISYDVNMVPNGTLLDPNNLQLLEATGVHPEGYNRRFAVIDDEVDRLFGEKICGYFTAQGIELHTIVIKGGEPDKRSAVSAKKATRRIFKTLICLSPNICGFLLLLSGL